MDNENNLVKLVRSCTHTIYNIFIYSCEIIHLIYLYLSISLIKQLNRPSNHSFYANDFVHPST